jgi:hypothetical protein
MLFHTSERERKGDAVKAPPFSVGAAFDRTIRAEMGTAKCDERITFAVPVKHMHFRASDFSVAPYALNSDAWGRNGNPGASPMVTPP